MAKALFYRWFGLGGIPLPLMSELKTEGLIVCDEGVKGSVTYRDFSAPGKRSSWRRQGFAGSIVVTKLRLVGLANANFLINVPLTDERIRAIHFTVESNGAFCAAFDASLFHDDWSGTIEYRFKTEEAARLVGLLKERAHSL